MLAKGVNSMFGLIRNEIYKTFHLKKFQLFMLVIVTAEIAFIMQIKASPSATGLVSMNGQSFPYSLLTVLPYITVIFMAIFISDTWIEEYRSGTFKLVLLRPVRRASLLHAKIIALLLSVIILIAFTILSAYITGTIAFGWGEYASIEGVNYSYGTGLGITMQSALTMVYPAFGFGVLITFVALLTDDWGITIGSSLGLMQLLQMLEINTRIRPYSIMYLMRTFHKELIEGLVPEKIIIRLTTLALYIVLFYLGSRIIIKRKDMMF